MRRRREGATHGLPWLAAIDVAGQCCPFAGRQALLQHSLAAVE